MSTKKTETKKVETGNKAKPQNPDNNKSERLDRLEEKMEMIEAGILVLVNAVKWANDTITPIGTHNPDILFKEYGNLEEAINAETFDGIDA